MNPYANSKVYGPYIRTDRRQHVICIFIDGTRRTVSYPKYLIEVSIGRLLQDSEVVHHINGDISDNRLQNLEILNRTTHTRLHVKRLLAQDFLCPVCGTEFTLHAKELHDIITNRKRKNNPTKSGPYCSKSCAGVGSNILAEIRMEYYSLLSLLDENLEVDVAKSENPVIDGNSELG